MSVKYQTKSKTYKLFDHTRGIWSVTRFVVRFNKDQRGFPYLVSRNAHAERLPFYNFHSAESPFNIFHSAESPLNNFQLGKI